MDDFYCLLGRLAFWVPVIVAGVVLILAAIMTGVERAATKWYWSKYRQ